MTFPTIELRRAAVRSKETHRPDLPLLSMSAVHGVRLRNEDDGRAASEDRNSYLVVHPGDIVVNKLSARDGAFGRSPLAGIVSPAYWVLAATPEFDSRFIDYYLHSAQAVSEIRRLSKFMPPAQYDIAWDDFARLPVPKLPLEQQRRIADFLDSQVSLTRRMLAIRTSQADLALAEKRSALADLYRSGAPRKLQTFLVQRPCYGVLVPRFAQSGGVPFIRVGDLLELQDHAHPLAAIEIEQSLEYGRTIVEAGDLLLSVVGSIDKAAVVPEFRAGSNVARAVARLRASTDDITWAIYAWIQTDLYLDQALLSTGGDTAQPTLNMGDLSQFTLRLDDPSRVSAAARDIIATEASQREVLSLGIQLLLEYETSLITAAVTGQVDVTTSRRGIPE